MYHGLCGRGFDQPREIYLPPQKRRPNQADADLRNIYEYIAFELQSPANASGQLDRLEENIKRLEQMPEGFREYENEPWHSRGLRIMTVDNYYVLYIPNTEDNVVTIIRVMYGGRDIDAQLKKYTSQ